MTRAVAVLAFLLVIAGLPLPVIAGTLLHVEDRAVLTRLEEAGYGFEHLFGADGATDLEGLDAASPAYRRIVETVSGDLASIARDFDEGGRPLVAFTPYETGRILDTRWLTSSASRFRLVGVVNRLDRRDFHATRGEDTCGEVRLVYRLAYSFSKDGRRRLSSRMPFNFNAVFDVPQDADGGCGQAVRRWALPDGTVASAERLVEGPLARAVLRFRQLELNAQVVRFPSGQEPAFGGQAVYLMRIFGLDGDHVAELGLENTPDDALLAGDGAMRAALADYVRANLDGIDRGVYTIPERFLARRVISFSTFGSARPVNNPFSRLFDGAAFEDIDFADGNLVRNATGLIARLDNGTCQGCHQASSTAGFHLIGLDDAETSPLNRILVGVSPHFYAEQPRRAAYALAVVEGRAPDRFRPLSFAPPARWEGGGPDYRAADAAMPCVMPNDPSGFGAAWQCGGETQCTPLAVTEGSHLGLAQCLLPADSRDMFSGHPCLSGTVAASDGPAFDDRYSLGQFTAFAGKASARDYTCRPPRIGVPGGMAYRQCDEKDRAFAAFGGGGPMPREICGLTGGKKFDICVSTGNFDQCLSGAIQRGNRAACSADRFCRDDYICQAFPPDTPHADKVETVGFCSPTYFMFQMRVDNHTTPWPRETMRDFGGEEASYRSIEAERLDGDPDDWW